MSNIQLIMETFYRIQIKQSVSKNAEKYDKKISGK